MDKITVEMKEVQITTIITVKEEQTSDFNMVRNKQQSEVKKTDEQGYLIPSALN